MHPVLGPDIGDANDAKDIMIALSVSRICFFIKSVLVKFLIANFCGSGYIDEENRKNVSAETIFSNNRKAYFSQESKLCYY